jgi:hypothetical protein
MNPDTHEAQASSQPPRKAPPVGRALRLLVGLLLIVQVAPVYFHVDTRVAFGALLLMLGLLIVYSLLHIVLSRRLFALGSGPGALLGLGILVVLYLAGGLGGPFLGRGEGRLAAFTFLGVSLVVAAVRADPGCEVMALPNAFLRTPAELACLFFSPLDALERKLRSKGAA